MYLLVLSLILSIHPQVVSARTFRPGRTNTGSSGLGFGSVTLVARQNNNNNNNNNNFFDQDEEQEQQQQQLRPGLNDNDNTHFFETNAQSSVQHDDDEADFFGIDDTEFPSELPPTESPMPTEEPTFAPSPRSPPLLTARPTTTPQAAASAAAAAALALKATIRPTLSPTIIVQKEVTTPTRLPTFVPTNAPSPTLTARPSSLPPAPVPTQAKPQQQVVDNDTSTPMPSVMESMSETPAFTWIPTLLEEEDNEEDKEEAEDEDEDDDKDTNSPTQSPTVISSSTNDNSLFLANATNNNTNATTTTTTTTMNVTTEAPPTSPPNIKENVTTTSTTTIRTTTAPTTSEVTAESPISTNIAISDAPTPSTPTWNPTTLQPTFRQTSPRIIDEEGEGEGEVETVGEFPIAGQISIQLRGITNAFPGDARLLFLATADEFIASASQGMVDDIRVLIVYQTIIDLKDSGIVPSNDDPPQHTSSTNNRDGGGRGRVRRARLLQQEEDVDDQVLQVDLGVEGLAHLEVFSATEWNEWLEHLFEQDGIEFVTMLQEMGDAENNPFFVPLERIQVVDRTSSAAQQGITTATLVQPTPSPNMQQQQPSTAAQPPFFDVQTNQGLQGDSQHEDQQEGVPMIAIIGAAVGGFVFLIIGVLLIRYVMIMEGRRKRSAFSHQSPNSLMDNFGSTPPSASAAHAQQEGRRSSTTGLRPTSIQAKPSIGGSSISSESYLTNSQSTNHHMNFNTTATMSSSNHNGVGGGGGGAGPTTSESDNASQIMSGDMTVSSQIDNASYAYSLEPGIEPSVAGTIPQSVAASGMSFSAYPGGSSVASMTSGASSFAFLKLPISKSGSGGSGGGAGAMMGSSGANLAGKPHKDVLAPPGKLGIVIDTTLDGPVVHKVNVGSALEGKLKSGDIIVAIDDVDTRAMTAASITALMVKTANQRRKLTIVSP